MYNFYVLEMRKLQSGEYEHDTYFVYDTDEQLAALKGESKYHDVMSKAALSVAEGRTIEHSAILCNAKAFPMLHGSYAVREEPTPEPEVE